MAIKDDKPGVYSIACSKTNRIYIGSSNSMRSRRYKHFGDLKKGIHRIEEMQKEFNMFGKDSFTYIVLEELPKDKKILLERENYWMDVYRDLLYNLSPNATRKGYKETDEVKEKLSKARKGTDNSNSRYTLEDFKKVKKLLLKGHSCYTISEMTGISSSLIKNFRKGKHWATEELGCINDWLKEEK